MNVVIRVVAAALCCERLKFRLKFHFGQMIIVSHVTEVAMNDFCFMELCILTVVSLLSLFYLLFN